MKFSLQPILDFGLQPSIDLMNLSFSDYIVHIELNLPLFLHMLRADSIDPLSSRVFMLDDQPVGMALIARRGWSSRLAAMSVIPAARRQGLGRVALEGLLEEAAARDERSMSLEVIESNTPAVALYTTGGFQTERRLVSYSLKDTAAPASAAKPAAPPGLEEVDIRRVARAVTLYGPENLPWQISGESLTQFGAPGRAYRLGEAMLVISNPAAEQVAIRSVIVSPPARRQQQATCLMRAVMALHPGKTWLVPAVCPEEFGGLFEALGFQRDEISQLQMIRTL
jgi:GNAT superfamily N-acetyltransferase